MLAAPINKIYVKVKSKFIGNYSNIIKAANVTAGSQLNPADLAQIVGEVVSLPKKITTEVRGYEKLSIENIQVGDTAIFSYRVIWNHQVVMKYNYQTGKDEEDVVLHNSVWYRGQEYFRCDVMDIFAVIRDGKVIMLNNWCMIEDMDKPSVIILPQRLTKLKNAVKATLTNCYQDDIEKGATVFCHPNKIQHYAINEKKFGIIKQKDICGSLQKSE